MSECAKRLYLELLSGRSFGLVTFWLSAALSLWWLTTFLPESFAFKTWSSVGDTCFGCLPKEWDSFPLYGLLILAFLHVSLLLQDRLATTKEGYVALPTEQPTQHDTREANSLSWILRFSSDPSYYRARRWVLCILRTVFCVYWLTMLTFLLRLQRLLGVRPCGYEMHQFTPRQLHDIGHNSASVYVLFHAEGYPDELRETLLRSKRNYAEAHGYSFVTTKQLFGEWDYQEWSKQLPLMQGNSSFPVAKRSRVWGKTLAIHHVLFEAKLDPKPQWVMWMDADAVIMRPEFSAESLIFGMCSRVDTLGRRTDDRLAALRCRHSEEWSETVHRQAMDAIVAGNPSQNLLDDMPQLVAVNVNSGAGDNFNSGVMMVKSSDWVRQQLVRTWQHALDPHFDQKSYGEYFKANKYPAKVKVLPGCVGANGYTSNWRAGRWMWGDFIAHTIGYDIPVNKLHAVRGLQEVADGLRHPLLLPPWIYTA